MSDNDPFSNFAYVLAISHDNQRLHVGVQDAFVGHLTVKDGSTDLDEDVDLFDDDGKPLKIVVADGKAALRPADGDPAIGQHLVNRIAVALAHAQVILDTAPVEEAIPPPERFPLLQADLRTVLVALANFYGDLHPPGSAPPPTKGGPSHDWAHRHNCAVH